MKDFRGTLIEPGDTVVYVGRQDMKASLNEGVVIRVDERGTHGAGSLLVRPTRSSDPLGGPSSGRAVRLNVLRKIVVLRKRRTR